MPRKQLDLPNASETEIQQAILLAIGARPDSRFWRNNVGVGRDMTGRVIRFGVPGSSDIFGIGPFRCPCCGHLAGGRFISLEVKTPIGRLRPEQRAWGDMVQAMGGLFDVVRSPADAVRVIEESRNG